MTEAQWSIDLRLSIHRQWAQFLYGFCPRLICHHAGLAIEIMALEAQAEREEQ